MMDSWEDEILIGEGVTLNSGAAPVTMRMASGGIDLIVYFAAFMFSSAAIGNATQGLNEALQTAVTIAWLVAMLILVPATVETLTRGRSVGRIALGLRIVRDDGGPVGFRHSFGRALVGLFELFFTLGMVAVITSMMSARGKRIGDFIAGTYSMRTRGVQRALPPMTMPFGLGEWAANADMRRLPDGLALTARMFVARAPGMHVQARARLGAQLSAEFEKYVAPLPPAGTHPETFITAVLAARREREYAIAVRQSQKSEQESHALRALPYGIPDTDN